ncbi:hypothetical protein JCM24511_02056 [Saitozyma sp. JCM 24511]|nr:hypothetical protein JCM24511_02056 [Saitozyma sp. JCM 24511]
MKRHSILFLTSPEHGQSNVHLAVIASLQDRHGDLLDIHLASFKSLQKRCPLGVTFNVVVGKPLTERHNMAKAQDFAKTSPGFFGACWGFPLLSTIFSPETPDEYVATARSIDQLILDTQPALIVVDPGFLPAKDASLQSGRATVMLSPNTLKENAAPEQGLGIFRIPCMGIGYTYPVPWYLVPLNFLALIFVKIWFDHFDPVYPAIDKARHQAGYPGPCPVFADRKFPALCMSHPVLEYPMIIPDDIVCCGPILQVSPPLQQVDKRLFDWISSRSTVLVVLGSHIRMNKSEAQKILTALRILLDKRPDVQVLWKLMKFGDFQLDGADVDGDRLRVTSWLEADPMSLLRTGKLICVVNHGGSNSYHEALATGTPQVILSPWFDCHDFGVRAEWLGIGKWGNKRVAPNYDEQEVTSALLSVVGRTPGDIEAGKIRRRAQECAEIIARGVGAESQTKGSSAANGDGSHGPVEGRDVAAEWIWKRLLESDSARAG